jgi:phosphoribosylanthranilate isomerase
MICQIYSATSRGEALALIEAGVDFVGIFPVLEPDYAGFYPGDTTVGSHVSFDGAREIIAAVRPHATSVALSLSNGAAEILAMAAALRPDVLHVSGPTFRADTSFRLDLARVAPETKLMHVVEVTDAAAASSSLAEAERLQSIADYLILDTGLPQSIGASGRAHDWEVSRQIVAASRVPVILAGGLEPANVAEAIASVGPWGVDSFSKTNRALVDGQYVKDLEKVRSFCQAAHEAERATRD